ncbi:glycosyl hydrolase, partial [bacterium]
PPDSARPWVYWFVMDGNFSREGITADLEAMKAAGIGGVIFMEGNVGVPRGPVKFMSPEWQQLWKHVVRESERLGISITLNGGPGWTGSGGPWVKAPLSMQITTYSTLDVSGPKKFEGTVPRPENRSRMSDFYQDIRVLAFPKPSGTQRISRFNEKTFIDRAPSVHGAPAFLPSYAEYAQVPKNETIDLSKVIDLTAKMRPDGRLDWDVPAGDWTIIRVGATNNGNSTLPAPEPGVGMESDKFSKAGLDAHFESYVGQLMKTVGPRKISPDFGWNMLHIDSWEVGVQNWTPGFLNEFKKRRGYDALNFLPALSGVVIDSTEKTERFLWDWRQTCSELLTENHVAYFNTLGNKNGFGLSIEPYDKVVGSDMDIAGAADVPMGEFWAYDPPPETNFSVTEAASSAHTNGKKIVGAESFTSGGGARWIITPDNLKSQGDWALTEGINRFVFHRYQHQPTLNQFPGMTMGGYGIQWERTQTFWNLVPGYHRYLARSQYLLRQGLPVSDVCYLVAEGAPQVFRAPKSATKNNPPERLGYSFDGCSPNVLIKSMTVKNGLLTLPDGTNYRVLVLPERSTMTPELLEKVAQLVEDGATVVGPRPLKSPSLSGFEASDAKIQALATKVWGNCDGVR